jgi:hypothetical protein
MNSQTGAEMASDSKLARHATLSGRGLAKTILGCG